MTYEDMTHVPTFQKAYKSYRMRFFEESKNAQVPVRVSLGVGLV